MGKKPGRKAFKGLASKGYRIRMMEPGAADSLLAIRQEAATRPPEPGNEIPVEPSTLPDFVRFLLSHEIFVAVAKRNGHPVGYAAAQERGDLYWLADHRVLTPDRRRGIGGALIAAVTQRARWFDHRAVGIPATVDNCRQAALYARNGFMTVSRKRHPAILANQRVDEMLEEAGIEAQRVLIKWL
ncbi:GNAT family N-acetyltransferase [Aurantimonas sp. C2-6-R+9]|uniref:GNAT family N-acetyltransferase n=1 Tax=unclassified Aurantimonas TaxID=2638230 RepID=UPI002E17B672|nr:MULTISPECIES: GNAT family N-acetyltransferase [unclassified Aurantimonas]MEC5290092.1 GNAT family N-acetyltransferase [Aurantimonas sp. C2-3-R2]MEC5380205.1 GNAT family N-acetyltransferase [Aurantimonas sp. C2-6-R+9]MEC5411156.1 GNAT family N-acetyltransferase [Aurantimonas sp. C2-4-R8]